MDWKPPVDAVPVRSRFDTQLWDVARYVLLLLTVSLIVISVYALYAAEMSYGS